MLSFLLLLVKSNEHADNPGAAIGNKDKKLFFVFVVDALGAGAGILWLISLSLITCHFFVAVSFGLPRFLCLISTQVSHLSKAVHRLHGLDTIN